MSNSLLRARSAARAADGARPALPAPLLLVVASVLFALMAVEVKTAASALPGPEVAFFRFAIGLAACAAQSRRRPLRPRNLRGLILRGGYGGAAVLFYFWAIAHLPVGIATLLNYTAPVFSALYAVFFFGEAIERGTIAALALTTLGVFLVAKGNAPLGSFGAGPWYIVGVASAVLSGAAVATIRELRRTDGSWEIFSAFCLGGALITAVPSALSWVNPGPRLLLHLLLVGSLSVSAQLLMTYSLRFVSAAAGGVIIQLTPVIALGLGWLFFAERIGPVALVGASLTLIGVSLGAYFATGGRRAHAPLEDS